MTKPYNSVKQYRFMPGLDERRKELLAFGHAILVSDPSEAEILAAHRDHRLAEVRANSLPGLIYIPPEDDLNDFFSATRQLGESRWQCARCKRLMSSLAHNAAGKPVTCGCHVGA